MGTSMSDPNSIWKNRLVPKSKVLNSGSKQHKSLKKIYLKNITDNQRYSSQIKIGQKQNKQQKIVDIKKTDPEYYYQNEFTPAFSTQIKDKNVQKARAGFQKITEQKSQKMIEPNKTEENYFIFGDKTHSNKKLSQKSLHSQYFIEQQLKLPLSSFVKSNAQASFISFSQVPSSQNQNKKSDQQLEIQQEQKKNKILKMLKEEKQQHSNKIRKYLPKSKKLRESYFTYGLSNHQVLKPNTQKYKKEGALKQSRLLENKSDRFKQKDVPEKKQNKNRDQTKEYYINSQSREDYYQTISKNYNILSNQKTKVKFTEQKHKRISKQKLQKLDHQVNQKLTSNFSSSSKTKSEKRLNLLYF